MTLSARFGPSILRAKKPIGAAHPIEPVGMRSSDAVGRGIGGMELLKLIYRATVMLSTLVIGAMAYRAYGPQIEKLAPLLERGQQIASELLAPAEAAKPSDSPPPMEFTADARALGAPLEPATLHDSNVAQVAAWDASEAAALVPSALPQANENQSSSPVTVAVRRLSELGVSQYALSRWGDEGKFFRFHCSAPCGGAGQYSRHFEAVAQSPTAAAQDVLGQVEAWQGTCSP